MLFGGLRDALCIHGVLWHSVFVVVRAVVHVVGVRELLAVRDVCVPRGGAAVAAAAGAVFQLEHRGARDQSGLHVCFRRSLRRVLHDREAVRDGDRDTVELRDEAASDQGIALYRQRTFG